MASTTNPTPTALQSAAAALSGAAAAAGVAAPAIVKGYTPVRQLTGQVVGVWGHALIRHENGDLQPLKVGDVIKKGDVVLTGQDGIVQLEAHPQAQTANAETERVISQVAQGDAETATAAGAGGTDGTLGDGLRVDRDHESVSPLSMQFAPLDVAAATPVAPILDLAIVRPSASPDVQTPR